MNEYLFLLHHNLMIMRKSFSKVKQLFAYCFFLVPSISLFANAPDILESKKLSVSFNIPAKNAIGLHEFYTLDAVNLAGYYWKTSNDSSDTPNWSKERYNYRKTGNSTGNLTVINSSGEPTLLELSFSSSTTASCNLSFWSMTGGQLVKESHTGTATVSLSDLILSDIPDGYQVSEPSGYYAPASISGGTLSAQDSYWSIYNESIIFNVSGNFSANITNDSGNLSASGSSFTYTKTGTNSATLSYTVDGLGYVFEYDFQFTGENAGTYSKYADYTGGTTDVTTGPFSLSGVAVPEQFAWEDYDDFSSGVLDASKWDLWWGAGGAVPTVVNDALQLSGSGNTNDPASSVIPKDLSYIAAERLPDMHSMALINQDDIYGIQAEFMIPSGPSDDTGLNLIFFDWAEDGSSKQEYGPELEYRSENGLRLEFAYTDPTSAESMQITRTAAFDTYYKMSLIHTETTSSMYSNGELIKEFSSVGFDPDTLGFAAFNDDGLPYTTYIKNVRVLRRSTTSTQPDPVTVVSDPTGQTVVTQVGNEYKWNSTLDGVTLWGVWNDEDKGWTGATIQYVSGKQKGSIGLTDQVGTNLEVNHSYIVDENGTIKVTENTAYQYYQITSVQNGVIETKDGSTLPLSDTSKFFTTRAAAEEYYYSKVNPKDWMWFDQYPWVYSNERQDWLYFYPSGSKLLYWSNKNQVWRQFN